MGCWVETCLVGVLLVVSLVKAGTFVPLNITTFVLSNRDYNQLPVTIQLSDGASLSKYLYAGSQLVFTLSVDPVSTVATVYYDGSKIRGMDLNSGGNGDDLYAPDTKDNDVNTLRYIASKSAMSEVIFDAVDFSAGTFLDDFIDEDGVNGGNSVGFLMSVSGESIYMTIATQGYFNRSAVDTFCLYNKNYNALSVKIRLADTSDPDPIGFYASSLICFGLAVDQQTGTTQFTYGNFVVQMIDLNNGDTADDLNTPNSDYNSYNTLQYFAGHSNLFDDIVVEAINFAADTYLLSFDDSDGISGGGAAHFSQYQEDSTLFLSLEVKS
ncbi:hypothetical protein Pelo_4942 [Pelomyxa schiedti]|nr:hypothetical protein Pelo_4942 [Pelomyxa schiedti]